MSSHDTIIKLCPTCQEIIFKSNCSLVENKLTLDRFQANYVVSNWGTISIKGLSKFLGVSDQALRDWANRFGLPRRPLRPGKARWKDIADAYASGASIKQIKTQFSCGLTTIHNARKAYNISKRDPKDWGRGAQRWKKNMW